MKHDHRKYRDLKHHPLKNIIRLDEKEQIDPFTTVHKSSAAQVKRDHEAMEQIRREVRERFL